MATVKQWVAGARPRTLPAAVAPVLMGSAIADYEKSFHALIALCALIVSISLQIGVNYANDYSDGIRGTDDVRVGPLRLVGQKLAKPETVRLAAILSFLVAIVAGLLMTVLSGLWVLLPIGLSAVVSAWFYTGGKRPYGYLGFGEVFVFTYFGLVAVCGTSVSQTGNLTTLSIIAGSSCGLLSMAILVVNNLRDIPSDITANKRTLAVRLGDKNTRWLYVITVVSGIGFSVALAITGPSLAIFGIFTVAVALEPMKSVMLGASGRNLIPVLAATGRTLLIYSIVVSFGIFNS